MISPYVESDPTKFCTYAEFTKGADTLKQFCLLRAESIKGQLCGENPYTSDGQNNDSTALVYASDILIADMGSMNSGGERLQMPENFQGGNFQGKRENDI